MKSLMIVLSLAMMGAVPALAQTSTTVPKVQAPAASAVKTGSVVFYSERGDWRASNLMGLKVMNAAGETIGDINEILIGKNGQVAAVVIGVGGFLGMGERHAAVAFDSVQLSRDKDNKPLARVDVTKELLKSAPEWSWQAASAN